MYKELLRSNKGQSLIEILIGIAVGVIIIGGVSATIAVVLRSNVQNKNSQTATSLAQEVLNEIGDIATANWHSIDLPVVGQYHVAITTGAVFVIQSGTEGPAMLTLDGKGFTRFFTVENISRDPNTGDIQPAASYAVANDDPSTKKIVVTVQWLEGSDTASVNLTKFVTRSRNLVFRQTDWVGGTGQAIFPSAGTVVNNRYNSKGGNIDTAISDVLETISP